MNSDRHIPYFDFYPADFMNGVRGLTPQEVGVYTMILCRIYEENGSIEHNTMRLSTYCGMREKTFEKVLEKLIDLDKFQLIDGMISNRRAAIEISKRANKLEIASRAGKASAKKRQQNQRARLTPVDVPFNHSNTDTDTVKKEEPIGSSKKRGTRLEDGWQPDTVFARQEGLAASDCAREADRFRDYWRSQPGQKGVKLDWDATWRNWVRKAVEGRRPTQRGRSGGMPGYPIYVDGRI